jgi:hypothetical protein
MSGMAPGILYGGPWWRPWPQTNVAVRYLRGGEVCIALESSPRGELHWSKAIGSAVPCLSG